MKDFIFNCTIIFQKSVFVITMYYLLLSLFGLYKKEDKGAEQCKPSKKFALLVAAHNEEMVIAKIIESLNELDYPKNMYDIFVIADNCDDNTASIARNYGANVYERNVSDKRGKGYALEWMFDRIFRMDKKYDAIAIFDADNLISKNFLKEMNYKLEQGYKVVQGYIDSKNPDDSWITQSYSISFWSANRLFQLARTNLGLSNQIGGTGFCMDVDILKKLGWGATCLTEDLEFTCKLVLNGHKVGWAHNAIVYDEKPLTLKQSWNQRKRWMQGFADVASRFFVKLMKKAIKERNFVALDCALYTMQPYLTVALGISVLLAFVQGANPLSQLLSKDIYPLVSMSQFLFTPLVMLLEIKLSKKMFMVFCLYSLNTLVSFKIFSILSSDNYYLNFLKAYDLTVYNLNTELYEPTVLYTILATAIYIAIFILILSIIDRKRSLKTFVWYLLYAIYTITWIPITIQGIIDKDKKEWSHTKHIRQISIQEVE
ncbi:glycosyltransferase family 2 protein [Clostridium magnum]|uniref:Beta-monoglucosyldiacylglycerol synthase n=1 Tax=Clostridium magnum DSM 2767 TaxID=1121326 RepID=A0A162SE60_9CLOT|nr:glycosyltransferase family 2 protein [Clostridium magnum]KZL91123.1 beta-monoglucosyldiacylglycerol synthase [Clostridium magnum DSM 2767]SHI18102.1 Glycosyltransferase, catalytic subunit of cellulose synthase and poly-beta-1,6-N-acetylglucosamine synthase [Clostridium magnum DSM 2767]